MKKAKSKLFYALAILLGALFVIACLMGFAACGDSDEPEEGGDGGNGGGNGQTTTYTFEAEDAKLWADENEMWYWLENDVNQGNMITGMGFLYAVQEVETASEGYSVGFLAHNNPTATFTIKSSKAVTGAKFTLRAASCDIDEDSIEPMLGSYVFGLSESKINPYSGSDHDILSVNGSKAALSGTLEGSDSVFKIGGSIADMDLAMDSWGTLTATIDLVEGDNTIVLTHDGAGVNWDYIQIETDAELSWTKTNNDGFVSFDEDYEPEDGGSGSEEPGGSGSEEPGEGGGSESSADRFVTGAYVSGTSVDAYYTYTNPDDSTLTASFTGSEVTSVDYTASTDSTDGLTGTYTVNGTAAPMDESQLKAFWGSGASNHEGAEYLTITLLADEDEQVTVYTDKSPNGISLDGGSTDVDDTFFTRIQDVTVSAEGKQLYTFAVDGETYAVVLGTVVSSAEAATPAFENTLTLEAENGAFINSTKYNGSGTETLGTEENTTYEGVTNVKNFNVSGDQIILQVYADAAIDNVQLDLYAWASASGFVGYSYTDYQNLITVNGTAVEYSGSLAATYDENTPQISATISLVKGLNYIVIELEKTGTLLGTANLGGVNVDKVELTWTTT